ncbi:hypothetical protein HHK36_009410 [Tetracentron sinense]|uniref:Pentatricopeptide repeat-containing protein n=1 Tax=Tetracentron sinense TaxID=13715 RepID=A0A834ZCV3_TETSI|nr:hypothetical protein HHK36_009410 [Tetracentron sinense]
MYVKCVNLEFAHSSFERMPEKDVASWNAMIMGFAQLGLLNRVSVLFCEMRFMGLKPDSITVIGLTQSSSNAKNLNMVKAIHCFGIQIGTGEDFSVTNTWIAAYAKCDDSGLAERVFHGIPTDLRTVVSWNSMIAGGYAKKGDVEEALALFYAMELAGHQPDMVTVVALLSACGQTGALDLGRWINKYAIANGFKESVIVCNALIDMYAKCGSINDAYGLFHTMPERTTVSWTTMIAGYALNGEFKEALNLFSHMVGSGLKPNHITFIAVLQACTHAEALEVIQNVPVKPDASVWGTLLGACKIHRDVEIGEYVADRLFELEPQATVSYVAMANIYVAEGRWEGIMRIRAMMKYNRVTKLPGCSLTQVNGKIHAFTVEDRGHHVCLRIYEVLDDLALQLKESRI